MIGLSDGFWASIGWVLGDLAMMFGMLLVIAVIFALLAWRHPDWLK